MQRTVLYKSNSLAQRCAPCLVRKNPFRRSDIAQLILYCSKQNGSNDIEIDVERLQNIFFPRPERMVFISHHSSDSKKAHEIKDAIESNCSFFSCFIDSDFWGNVYEIEGRLQDNYAYNSNTHNYNLETINNIAKHLYLSLSTALIKAIKSSPFFLYVPHSDEEAQGTGQFLTESPWICQELLISSLCPERRTILGESQPMFKAAANINFKHTADTSHLHTATLEEFITFINRH